MRAEKPQRGMSGVPFMNSITRSSLIARLISSRICSLVMVSPLRASKLVFSESAWIGPPISPSNTSYTSWCCWIRDRPANPSYTTSARRWSPPPVRSVTVAVAPGQRLLDALLHFVGGRHALKGSAPGR